LKAFFSLALVLSVAVCWQLAAGPLYALDVPHLARAAPDLVLVAVAACAVRSRSTPGVLLAALLAGACLDGLSLDPPCTHLFTYVVTAAAGTSCGRRGLEENALARIGFLAPAAALGALAGIAWLHATAYESAVPTLRTFLLEWAYHVALGGAALGLLEPFLARAYLRELSREMPWSASG